MPLQPSQFPRFPRVAPFTAGGRGAEYKSRRGCGSIQPPLPHRHARHGLTFLPLSITLILHKMKPTCLPQILLLISYSSFTEEMTDIIFFFQILMCSVLVVAATARPESVSSHAVPVYQAPARPAPAYNAPAPDHDQVRSLSTRFMIA